MIIMQVGILVLNFLVLVILFTNVKVLKEETMRCLREAHDYTDHLTEAIRERDTEIKALRLKLFNAKVKTTWK